MAKKEKGSWGWFYTHDQHRFWRYKVITSVVFVFQAIPLENSQRKPFLWVNRMMLSMNQILSGTGDIPLPATILTHWVYVCTHRRNK